MANEQNLIKFTKDNAKENARKGGIKCQENRRKRKKMKEALQLILELPVSERNKNTLAQMGIESDTDMTNQMLLAVAAFQKAIKGDVRAMEFIRDTTGQKTLDKLDEAKVKLTKSQAKLIESQIKKENEENDDQEQVVIVNDCEDFDDEV